MIISIPSSFFFLFIILYLKTFAINVTRIQGLAAEAGFGDSG